MEVRTRKIIHFRAGGKQRHCTIPEFGYLTGMFTREELVDEDLSTFLKDAVRDDTGFEEGSHGDFWTEITGNQHHSSRFSKIADIYDPVLRILHKLITYNFFQRSNQNDKPYVDDLWLMRLFVKGAPYRYADAPYALARFLEKQRDGYLCCGHFITKIFRRLDCLGTENDRYCSVPIEMRDMSWRDLSASKLLKPGTHELIDFMGGEPQGGGDDDDEDEEEDPDYEEGDDDEGDDDDDDDDDDEPTRGSGRGGQFASFHEQQPHDPYSMQAMARQLGQIQETQSQFYGAFQDHQRHYQEDQQWIGSQFDRLGYHQDRYQPYMESWANREAQNMGTSLPAYNPPDIFMPTYRQGGFYYPPRNQDPQPPPRPHDQEAGGSGLRYTGSYAGDPQRPIFGSHDGTFEGGGTPSVFDDPNN